MEVGEERVWQEVVVHLGQVLDPDFSNILEHLGKVDAQHLEDGKDDVQAVGDVEGGEDVVEAVAPHVLAHQHHDAHKVANETEPAER